MIKMDDIVTELDTEVCFGYFHGYLKVIITTSKTLECAENKLRTD